MGAFNTVTIPCPKCGREEKVQSKAGDCTMTTQSYRNADVDDMVAVAKNEFQCPDCGTHFRLQLVLNAYVEAFDPKEI